MKLSRNKAERRYQANISSKTFSGRDEYLEKYERKLELSRREKKENDLKLLNYIQKERKHNEAYNDIQRRK